VKMNLCTRLFLMALLVPALLHGQDYTDLIKRPVNVFDRSGGGNQSVLLSGIEGDSLVIAVGEGQVMRPINDSLQLFYPVTDRARQAENMLRAGRYQQAFEVLRPLTYPLLKYISIPPEQFNIHEQIGLLYAAAIRSGNEEEALYISRQLPLEELEPYFTSLTFELASRIAKDDRAQEAMTIMERIPINEGNPELHPLVLNFAGQLRDEGLLREALFLYQRLQAIDESNVKQRATIWNAYCNLLLGNRSIASVFLESVGEVPRGDEDFSLFKMVEGRILLDERQYVPALTSLSQAIVYSDLSDDWMPELLYNTGVCYAAIDQPETARQVFNELEIFFPENPWTDKGRQRMQSLPEKD